MAQPKAPKSFLVVLPGEIIEIPQDSGKSVSLDEMMKSEYGDIFEVADPRSEFEQTVISEMQIAAFADGKV